MTPIKFKQPFNGLAPSTIYNVDEASKTLRPFGSGEAYQGSGYQFGQEQIGDPNNYSGYKVGDPINRAADLQAVKDSLNTYQQQIFDQEQAPTKRASSTLVDSINSSQGDLDKYLSEYNTLRTQLQTITAPNYQAAYTQLREQQGVPGLENQYTSLNQQRRELPYIERANTGNAGVATESQLSAQTAQKDIPLYIQQTNALDRLKLAQDFITNSLNLKELDYNASRGAITDAANLLSNTVSFTSTHLNDLITRQKDERTLAEQAQQFIIDNGIDQPYYQIGNTIYDSATRTPKFVNNNGTFKSADGKTVYSTPDQFFKDSGINSFDQIYHINSTTMADKNAVVELRQKYPDAGISSKDSFATASSKLQNSRIYQEQVRPPARAGGGTSSGGGGGALGLSNQQIDNISPIVTQFQNSPIVKNYNVLGETRTFVNSLSDSTKNPTDDQALIYSIAKALDPDSVVREGEYATVQKYAQSWAQAYGKSVNQAFLGTGFLSETARKNIKATLETRFKATESSYKNLYAETERRVNLIGSTDKGSQLLNNYGAAFASSSSNTPTPTPTPQPVQQAQPQGFISKAINFLFGK